MPKTSLTRPVERDKQAVRERVWRLPQEEGVARFPGAERRIPNFEGAGAAADRLATLPDWQGSMDLVICGGVAVNRSGARVGKGGGFSDLELGLLIEAGSVDDGTVIATSVHPLQVLDEELPETEHDFRVDLIVTPEAVIRPRRVARPRGILWDHLPEERSAKLPAVAALRR